MLVFLIYNLNKLEIFLYIQYKNIFCGNINNDILYNYSCNCATEII